VHSSIHDFFFGRVSRRKLFDNPALSGDEYPVREAHDFRQMGGNNYDGNLLIGKFIDQLVYLSDGSDIDYSGPQK